MYDLRTPEAGDDESLVPEDLVANVGGRLADLRKYHQALEVLECSAECYGASPLEGTQIPLACPCCVSETPPNSCATFKVMIGERTICTSAMFQHLFPLRSAHIRIDFLR